MHTPSILQIMCILFNLVYGIETIVVMYISCKAIPTVYNMYKANVFEHSVNLRNCKKLLSSLAKWISGGIQSLNDATLSNESSYKDNSGFWPLQVFDSLIYLSLVHCCCNLGNIWDILFYISNNLFVILAGSVGCICI